MMTALGNATKTRHPLTPLCSSSSLHPFSPQEEARLHLAERTRDDAAGGAPGDPQHRQGL